MSAWINNLWPVAEFLCWNNDTHQEDAKDITLNIHYV